MKQVLITITCLFVFITGFSQTKGTSISIGENYTISSKVLNQDREIQVYLPKDYASTDKNYPVVYLLDGQRFFLYGASLYQSFSEFNLTPDFIVVGITNIQANRMNTFSSGAKDFGEFLQKEVISLVDSTYRTSKKRLLFGWAYGGGFGIETLMSMPNLFDGYILSSPFPVSSKMDRFKEFVNKNSSLDTFIYFASDVNEFGVKEGTEEFNDFLSKTKTNLRWEFKVLSGEEHRSTVYPSLYHGLKAYFENYTEISFSTIEEFELKGGLNYVDDYYTKRAALYGLTKELAPFTKYSIIRLAIRADNYNRFNALVKSYDVNTLISQLKLSWLCTIGEFYTKNLKKKEALQFYNLLSKKYPSSNRVKKGLDETAKLF